MVFAAYDEIVGEDLQSKFDLVTVADGGLGPIRISSTQCVHSKTWIQPIVSTHVLATENGYSRFGRDWDFDGLIGQSFESTYRIHHDCAMRPRGPELHTPRRVLEFDKIPCVEVEFEMVEQGLWSRHSSEFVRDARVW